MHVFVNLSCQYSMMKVLICGIEVEIGEDIPVMLHDEVVMTSFLKGYHAYEDVWKPFVGETLDGKREPNNVVDKYAASVNKEERIVGHIEKGKTKKFAKTIFYFLGAEKNNRCVVKITGYTVNERDGERMKVPFELYVSGPKNI